MMMRKMLMLVMKVLYIDWEEKWDKLNESLGIFGISPLKFHGLKKRTQVSMAQEKLERSYEKQKEY